MRKPSLFIRFFSLRRSLLLLAYWIVFFFAMASLAITIDEYQGGNAIAEFGTGVFSWFTFPFENIWDWVGGRYNSEYEYIIGPLFWLNLLINCIGTVWVVDRVWGWILGRFFSRR